VPDPAPPDDPFEGIAAQFAHQRARDAALVRQAQAWAPAPPRPDDMDLGDFGSVEPMDADQISPTYARLAALSAQRLRVLSAQLREQYAEHGMSAFVRDRLLYNPATQEVETAGEEPTALARLEAEERKHLAGLLTTAVRLKMEARTEQSRALHGARMAALAQAMCEQAGLDWSLPETRRLAQRAVLAAEARVSGHDG